MEQFLHCGEKSKSTITFCSIFNSLICSSYNNLIDSPEKWVTYGGTHETPVVNERRIQIISMNMSLGRNDRDGHI